MSDSTTPQVPAGWYPDPAGGPRPRWWNGTAWTDHYADPTPAPAQPVVPPVASTPVTPSAPAANPAASAFAPVDPVPTTPAQQATPYVPFASQQQAAPTYTAAPAYSGATELTAPPGTPTNTIWIWLTMLLPVLAILPAFGIDWVAYTENVMADPEGTSADWALITSPAMIATILLSLVTVPLVILFSFLDFRALKNRGVPQPFHWLFSLSYLVIGTTAVYVIGRAVVVRRRTGSGLGIMWAQIAVLVALFALGILYVAVIFTSLMSAIPTDSFSQTI